MSTTEASNNDYPGALAPGCTSVALMLTTDFPYHHPVTRGKKKKKKKVLHFGLAWRKEEEMGLKLQRKERSADQEEPFFPISKNTQS